jgi:response regulator RpfG family c-di-GMP phosphodiesterase
MDEISAIVSLTHHENWDGSGYPGRVDISTGKPLEKTKSGAENGLKGKEIPIYGRVVAMADVYDALRSKRVYKEAWTEEDVLHEMQRLSGTKFDPDLVDVFFDVLDVIRSITARYPDHEKSD